MRDTRVSFLSSLDRIRSTSAREQSKGLADLRHVFASNPASIEPLQGAPFFSLQKDEWKLILDTLFKLVSHDCIAYRRRSSNSSSTSVATNALHGRLAQAGAALREVCAALVPQLETTHSWATKPLIGHVNQIILVGDDEICRPLALDYLRVLGSVVGLPAVTERLRDRWGTVADLCLEVCRRLQGLPKGALPVLGGSIIMSTQSSLTTSATDVSRAQELAEVVLILRHLTSAPNAPVLDKAHDMIITLLSLLGIKRGQVDVVATLANVLEHTAGDMGDLTRDTMRSAIRGLRAGWGKEKELRNEIIRVLIVGRRYLFAPQDEQANKEDISDQVGSLVSIILGEYGKRPERDQLRVDDLDLRVPRTWHRASSEKLESSTFEHALSTPAFGLKSVLSEARESVWMVPWLSAYLLRKMEGDRIQSTNSQSQTTLLEDDKSHSSASDTDANGDGTRPRKRHRPSMSRPDTSSVDSPLLISYRYISSLLKRCASSPSPSIRIPALQTLAMGLGQQANQPLPKSIMYPILSSLLLILTSSSSPTVSSWSFLALANCVSHPEAADIRLRPLWSGIWAQGVRRGSRAAGLALAGIVTAGLLDGNGAERTNGVGLSALGELGMWGLTDGPIAMIERILRSSEVEQDLGRRVALWVASKWKLAFPEPNDQGNNHANIHLQSHVLQFSPHSLANVLLACVHRPRIRCKYAPLAILHSTGRSWVRSENEGGILDFLLCDREDKVRTGGRRFWNPERDSTVPIDHEVGLDLEGSEDDEWTGDSIVVMKTIIEFWTGELQRIERLFDPPDPSEDDEEERDYDRNRGWSGMDRRGPRTAMKGESPMVSPFLLRYATTAVIISRVLTSRMPLALHREGERLKKASDELILRVVTPLRNFGQGLKGGYEREDGDISLETTLIDGVLMTIAQCIPDVRLIGAMKDSSGVSVVLDQEMEKLGLFPLFLHLSRALDSGRKSTGAKNKSQGELSDGSVNPDDGMDIDIVSPPPTSIDSDNNTNFSRNFSSRTDEGVSGSPRAIREYVSWTARLVTYAFENPMRSESSDNVFRQAVPLRLVTNISALSPVSFLFVRSFLTSLLGNPNVSFSLTESEKLLRYVGIRVLQDTRLERCEPAVNMVIELIHGAIVQNELSFGSHTISPSEDVKEVMVLAEDLLDWVTRVASRKYISSRMVHRQIIQLLEVVLKGEITNAATEQGDDDDPNHEPMGSLARSALLGLFSSGPVQTQLFACSALPSFFPQKFPDCHESRFRLVYEKMPSDTSSAEAMAVRALSLSIMATECPAIRRRGVYHLFETAAVRKSQKYVQACAQWFTTRGTLSEKGLGSEVDLFNPTPIHQEDPLHNGDSRIIVVLYASQIVHTWIESSRGIQSFPFRAFGFTSLEEIVRVLAPEIVAQGIRTENKNLIQQVSEILGLDVQHIIQAAFVRAVVYATFEDTARELLAVGRGSSGSRLSFMISLLGSSQFTSLLKAQLGQVIGALLSTIDDPAIVLTELQERKETDLEGGTGSRSKEEITDSSWIGTINDVWAQIGRFSAKQDEPLEAQPLSSLSSLQQPHYPAKLFLSALERLVVLASPHVSASSQKSVFSFWTPALYTSTLRSLLSHLSPPFFLGNLAALATTRHIRLLISLANDVATKGYPLEMALLGLRGVLIGTFEPRGQLGHSVDLPSVSWTSRYSDPLVLSLHAAVSGISHYLYQQGLQYLQSRPSTLASLAVPFILTVRLIENDRHNTEVEHRSSNDSQTSYNGRFSSLATVPGQVVSWLSLAVPKVPAPTSDPEQARLWRIAKRLVMFSCQSQGRGSVIKDRAESLLLVGVLEDWIQGKQSSEDGDPHQQSTVLSSGARKEAIRLLVQGGFQVPLNPADDILGLGQEPSLGDDGEKDKLSLVRWKKQRKEICRYAPALWKLRNLGGNQFRVWVGRVVGRAALISSGLPHDNQTTPSSILDLSNSDDGTERFASQDEGEHVGALWEEGKLDHEEAQRASRLSVFQTLCQYLTDGTKCSGIGAAEGALQNIVSNIQRQQELPKVKLRTRRSINESVASNLSEPEPKPIANYLEGIPDHILVAMTANIVTEVGGETSTFTDDIIGLFYSNDGGSSLIHRLIREHNPNPISLLADVTIMPLREAAIASPGEVITPAEWVKRLALGLIYTYSSILSKRKVDKRSLPSDGRLFASSFLIPLLAPLAQISTLAEQILGPLVHLILLAELEATPPPDQRVRSRASLPSANLGTGDSIKSALSSMYGYWFGRGKTRLENGDSLDRPNVHQAGSVTDLMSESSENQIIQILLKLLLFLRKQPIPQETTLLDRTWLDVDNEMAAYAGMSCGWPITSFFFAELNRSRTQTLAPPPTKATVQPQDQANGVQDTQGQIPQALLERILPALPEPDSRHTLTRPPGIPSILARLAYEQDGQTRLLVHSARLDAQLRAGIPVLGVDASGVGRALGEMGVRGAVEASIDTIEGAQLGYEVGQGSGWVAGGNMSRSLTSFDTGSFSLGAVPGSSVTASKAHKLTEWRVSAEISAVYSRLERAGSLYTAKRVIDSSLDRALSLPKLWSAGAENGVTLSGISFPLESHLALMSEISDALSSARNVKNDNHLPSLLSSLLPPELSQNTSPVSNPSTSSTVVSSQVPLAPLSLASFRSTFYTTLTANARLRFSAEVSLHSALRAEVRATLHTIRLARLAGAHQDALSGVEYLYLIRTRCAEENIRIEGVIDVEGAAVLWETGERDAAIGMLQRVKDDSNVDDKEFNIPKAIVLAKLASHLNIARLEQPEGILSKYVRPAVAALGIDLNQGPGIRAINQHPQTLDAFGLGSGTFAALTASAVFHQVAIYCDTQLRSANYPEQIAQLENTIARRKNEIDATDKLIQQLPSTETSKRRRLESHKQIPSRWCTISQRELAQIKQTRQDFLSLAIESFLRALGTADTFDTDILKLLALWLQYADEEPATAAVARVGGCVPTHKWVGVMHQLTSRLGTDRTDFQKVLKRIVLAVCVGHTILGMHYLYAATQVNEQASTRSDGLQGSDAMRSRADAAVEISSALDKNPHASRLWKQIRQADSVYQRVATTTTDSAGIPFQSGKEVAINNIPHGPALSKYGAALPLPTMCIGVNPRPSGDYSNVPIVQRFRTRVMVAQGNSKPKIVVARLSNGEEHKILIKGGANEDLRQDAVMEQVFSHASSMLTLHPATISRQLGIRTYAVLPLSPTTGLIEFVRNTVSLNDYLIPAHARYRPNDITVAQCRNQIAAVKDKDYRSRLRAYELVCSRFKPVLGHFFFEISTTPEAWFARRLAYARSTASISILGHVLGLGDRHGQNILLDKLTGEAVHIDLGVAFDAGRVLPIPEVVPFRLTRDVVDPFGCTGVEGVFRRSCEAVLSALREERDGVRTLLDVLRYDPLYKWSLTVRRARRVQRVDDGEQDQGSSDQKDKNQGETTRQSKRLHQDVVTNVGREGKDGDDTRFEEGAEYVENENEAQAEAKRALDAVERKLSSDLSVAAAVNELIVQSMDTRNLSTLFVGWAAFL